MKILQDADLKFLSVFLNEDIYLIPDNFNKTSQADKSDFYKAQPPISEQYNNSEIRDQISSVNTISDILSVVIFENRVESIVSKEKLFLIRILDTLKIDINSVNIINLYDKNNPQKLVDAISKINVKNIIAFGIPDELLPEDYDNYNIYKFNDCQYFICPNLTDIAQNKDEKLNLWAALKKMFNTLNSTNE